MSRLSCASLALALLLAAPAKHAPAAIDVKVNNDSPGTIQNEVTLTLVPAMPGRVIVAYNDLVNSPGQPVPPPVGLGVSYSSSPGSAGSWTDTQLSVPTHPIAMPPSPPSPDDGIPLSNIFDPISGADTQGRAYVGYIATDDSGAGAPSGLYVEYSNDGGATWSGSFAPGGPATVSFDTRATSTVPGNDPNYRFNDKPHLAVDRNAGTPNADNVYVGFIQDVNVGQPSSDIMFSRSTDRGLTFSNPIKISDALSGVGEGNGPNLAVASDGTVYAAWLDVDVTNPSAKPGTLWFDKSIDGGVSFSGSGDVKVADIRSVANNLSTATGSGDDARARSYPSIAVDPSNPQNVYLVYAEDPDYFSLLDGPDEADVFLLKSTDGGATWPSPPVRINDDATNTDQFEPWIAVKPDGTIDVAWYDKRLDPLGDQLWDVYLATSLDGGGSFLPNVRVTDQSFAAPNRWIGEYLGLAVDNQYAYIGFTSGTGDPNFGDVYFDRILNPTTSVVIPEPTALAVWSLLAGLVVGLRWRRR